VPIATAEDNPVSRELLSPSREELFGLTGVGASNIPVRDVNRLLSAKDATAALIQG
jgi:hypothetical protein